MSKDLFEKKYFVLFLITLLGYLAYSNTFTVPFQFDDDAYVINNPLIRTFHYFLAPFDVAELDKLSPVNFPSVLRYAFMTRILGYLSLAVNYKFNGLNVVGYHVVNLLLHILNGFLIYFIMDSIFNNFTSGNSAKDKSSVLFKAIPPAVALLFVIHPIQTHAVTYITSRFVLMGSFFFLLSLLLYIRSVHSGSSAWRYSLYTLAIMSAAAAMLCKEFTFTLPVIIALCDITFLEGPVRGRLKRLVPISITILVIPALVFIQQGSFGALDSTMRTITAADVTRISRLDYLFTQFRVIVTYLRLLIFPVNQNLDHDAPVYHSLLSPPVFLSFLLLAAIFFLAAFLLYRSIKANQPSSFNLLYRFISFGIIWFFITLSVESSVLPLGELIAEYRLYLPSIGFILAFTSGLILLVNIYVTSPKIAAIIFAAFICTAVIALSTATYLRNGVWKNEITLWEDTARKSPNKLRPHQNLGTYYQMAGRLEEARNELLLALKLDPGNFEIHNNLGIVLRKLGDYEGAIREYSVSLQLKPSDPMARYNLGNIYLAMGRYEDALREYTECLKIIPEYDELHNNMGIVYQKTGRFREAAARYQEALRLNPENEKARNNLSGLLQYRQQNNSRQH
jgi:Flp pilus assembly protein TadD